MHVKFMMIMKIMIMVVVVRVVSATESCSINVMSMHSTVQRVLHTNMDIQRLCGIEC